jgi:hypothetical protein
VLDLNANTFIKYYLNMYNKNIESKVIKNNRRYIPRFRRLSINRIFVKDVEVEHTNYNVMLNLSVFNSEKVFLNKYLKGFESFRLKQDNLTKKGQESRNKVNTSIKIKHIKFNKQIQIYNLYKNYLINYFGILNVNNKIKDMFGIYLSKLIRNNIYKLYYKYLLYINTSKLNDTYLNKLIPILEKIYLKKPILNVINLKHYFVDSELLTKIMLIKIRNRKNDLRKLIMNLKNSLDSRLLSLKKDRMRINKTKYLILRASNKKILLYKPLKKINLEKNYFSKLIQEVHFNNRKNILNYVNHKNVTGIMMKINGRLSKRFTASRSVQRVFNKGFIKNMYPEYNGLSTPVIRGYMMSNIQYTNINYKTRVGAFGIKG